METEELIKLVDGIYKNILDKFNPGARQMINAGKAYLKALHGAAAASRLYVDAISKLARQAQQGTWGGSSDIGEKMRFCQTWYYDSEVRLLQKYVETYVVHNDSFRQCTPTYMSVWIHTKKIPTYSEWQAIRNISKVATTNLNFVTLQLTSPGYNIPYTTTLFLYGAALMKIVEVYKEIQDQQMNILKAFYVDLLVPLETNLEKDTKVVQSEQKRFLQQHKQRAETYSKAAAMMKKQRKKSRSSTKTGLAMDKELKNMQVLEEEKTKLDAFCEQSLKNAMTQERRRYGFVLERQCSLAKHHLSYHSQGVNAYQQNIEKWSEVAKTREFLPDSVENIFTNRLRNISVWQDEDVYSNPRSPNFEDDRMSIASQLRKTKSMDASCLDIRSIGDVGSPVTTMSRAKSEYNLNSSTHSLIQVVHTQQRRPKSMAVPPPPQWDTQLARALYAYLSSGENQLSFLEGDLIALIGERNKGWQFGENLRTQCSGWFPLAYTELLDEPNLSPSHRNDASGSQGQSGGNNNMQNSSGSHEGSEPPSGNNTLETPTPRMFGDTIHLHRSSNNAKQIRRAIGSNNIPPPQLPAPVPTPSLPYQKVGLTQSQSTTFTSSVTKPTIDSTTLQSNYSQSGIKSSTSSFNFQTPPSIAGPYSTHPQPSRSDRPTAGANLPIHLQTKGGKIGVPVGNVSLHSSNDSGFSNDPPPQPEIDYSDDDSIPGQTKLTNRMSKRERQPKSDRNNNTLVRGSSIRHSQSHGSLVGKQYHMASDPETLSREHKHLVKRTKSFWKFGKNNSDSEILEGMALWRHRDLVDVEETKVENKKFKTQKRVEVIPRDRSNDSDRTINNKTVEKPESKQKMKKLSGNKKPRNESEKKNKLSLPPRKDSAMENVDYDHYNEANTRNIDNQFYDDEDGLMLKSVNRKNILQQYDNDDSTEIESENSDSDITSDDDPYDCIRVEDQKVDTKSGGNFPNVAEIGKKLEKLSKSTKFSPTKGNNKENNQDKNNVSEKNKLNIKHNVEKMNNNDINNDIIQYQEKRYSFRTFRDEPVREKQDSTNKYYSNRQSQEKRNNETGEQEKRRYYASGDSNRSNTNDRRTGGRPSYESIESDVTQNSNRVEDSRTKSNRRSNGESEKCERMKYYDSTNDESDMDRQFLPRTKLTKTNSNGSKYEENDLMGYGETLQRRLKNPEYGSKFDDKSPHNGNMYGPWYDLWGLDATARK